MGKMAEAIAVMARQFESGLPRSDVLSERMRDLLDYLDYLSTCYVDLKRENFRIGQAYSR